MSRQSSQAAAAAAAGAVEETAAALDAGDPRLHRVFDGLFVRGLTTTMMLRNNTSNAAAAAVAAGGGAAAHDSTSENQHENFINHQHHQQHQLENQQVVWCADAQDGTISVRRVDAPSRPFLRIPPKQNRIFVTCLTHVASTQTIWAGLSDGCIRVYEINNATANRAGAFTAEMMHHDGAVCCLAVGSDGLVYSGGYDWKILQWDPLSRNFLRLFFGHTNNVRCLVSAQGNPWRGVFLSHQRRRTLDAKRRQQQNQNENNNRNDNLDDHDDDGGGEPRPRRPPAPMTRAHELELLLHPRPPAAASSSASASAVGGGIHLALPRRSVLFTGADDGSIRVWDARAPRQHTKDVACLHTFTGAHTRGVHALLLHFATNTLWSGGEDGAIIVWDLETCAEVTTRLAALHTAPVTTMEMLPNNTVWSGGKDGLIVIWDALSRTALRDFRAGPGVYVSSIKAMQRSETRRVWCNYSDGTLQVWNVEVPLSSNSSNCLIDNNQLVNNEDIGDESTVVSVADGGGGDGREQQQHQQQQENQHDSSSALSRPHLLRGAAGGGGAAGDNQTQQQADYFYDDKEGVDPTAARLEGKLRLSEAVIRSCRSALKATEEERDAERERAGEMERKLDEAMQRLNFVDPAYSSSNNNNNDNDNQQHDDNNNDDDRHQHHQGQQNENELQPATPGSSPIAAAANAAASATRDDAEENQQQNEHETNNNNLSSSSPVRAVFEAPSSTRRSPSARRHHEGLHAELAHAVQLAQRQSDENDKLQRELHRVREERNNLFEERNALARNLEEERRSRSERPVAELSSPGGGGASGGRRSLSEQIREKQQQDDRETQTTPRRSAAGGGGGGGARAASSSYSDNDENNSRAKSYPPIEVDTKAVGNTLAAVAEHAARLIERKENETPPLGVSDHPGRGSAAAGGIHRKSVRGGDGAGGGAASSSSLHANNGDDDNNNDNNDNNDNEIGEGEEYPRKLPYQVLEERLRIAESNLEHLTSKHPAADLLREADEHRHVAEQRAVDAEQQQWQTERRMAELQARLQARQLELDIACASLRALGTEMNDAAFSPRRVVERAAEKVTADFQQQNRRTSDENENQNINDILRIPGISDDVPYHVIVSQLGQARRCIHDSTSANDSRQQLLNELNLRHSSDVKRISLLEKMVRKLSGQQFRHDNSENENDDDNESNNNTSQVNQQLEREEEDARTLQQHEKLESLQVALHNSIETQRNLSSEVYQLRNALAAVGGVEMSNNNSESNNETNNNINNEQQNDETSSNQQQQQQQSSNENSESSEQHHQQLQVARSVISQLVSLLNTKQQVISDQCDVVSESGRLVQALNQRLLVSEVAVENTHMQMFERWDAEVGVHQAAAASPQPQHQQEENENQQEDENQDDNRNENAVDESNNENDNESQLNEDELSAMIGRDEYIQLRTSLDSLLLLCETAFQPESEQVRENNNDNDENSNAQQNQQENQQEEEPNQQVSARRNFEAALHDARSPPRILPRGLHSSPATSPSPSSAHRDAAAAGGGAISHNQQQQKSQHHPLSALDLTDRVKTASEAITLHLSKMAHVDTTIVELMRQLYEVSTTEAISSEMLRQHIISAAVIGGGGSPSSSSRAGNTHNSQNETNSATATLAQNLLQKLRREHEEEQQQQQQLDVQRQQQNGDDNEGESEAANLRRHKNPVVSLLMRKERASSIYSNTAAFSAHAWEACMSQVIEKAVDRLRMQRLAFDGALRRSQTLKERVLQLSQESKSNADFLEQQAAALAAKQHDEVREWHEVHRHDLVMAVWDTFAGVRAGLQKLSHHTAKLQAQVPREWRALSMAQDCNEIITALSSAFNRSQFVLAECLTDEEKEQLEEMVAREKQEKQILQLQQQQQQQQQLQDNQSQQTQHNQNQRGQFHFDDSPVAVRVGGAAGGGAATSNSHASSSGIVLTPSPVRNNSRFEQ